MDYTSECWFRIEIGLGTCVKGGVHLENGSLDLLKLKSFCHLRRCFETSFPP